MELNKFYIADSVKFMREKIPNDFIDLTINSPPYDNLRQYKGYILNFEGMAKELYRVTKQGGVVVWIVGDKTEKGSETGTSFKQALYFKKIGFNLHDTMIYQKDAFPFPETNRYYPSFEYMFIFSKGKPKTTNLLTDKPNKTYGTKVAGTARQPDGELTVKNNIGGTVKKYGVRSNVWLYGVGHRKSTNDIIAYQHPAIFPEKLAQDHILTWSDERDIVLDPMCGSGTACKMAKLNNRDFIGIDISEEYINNICIPRLSKLC
jgi:site-specific DNA-methyltransferase (adenine-specific)